jgi:hypothetical protein
MDAEIIREKPMYCNGVKISPNKQKDNMGINIFPMANNDETMDVSVFFKAI